MSSPTAFHLNLPAFEISCFGDRKNGQSPEKIKQYILEGFRKGLKEDIAVCKKTREPQESVLVMLEKLDAYSHDEEWMRHAKVLGWDKRWSDDEKAEMKSQAELTTIPSVAHEKFLRFCYNLNLPKAIKWKKKFDAIRVEQLDDMMESCREGKRVVLGKKGNKDMEGEHAVVEMGKDLVETNKDMKKVLDQVAEIISWKL